MPVQEEFSYRPRGHETQTDPLASDHDRHARRLNSFIPGGGFRPGDPGCRRGGAARTTNHLGEPDAES